MDKNISAADAGTVQIGSFTVNRLGFGAMRITGSGVWGDPPDVDLAKQVLRRAIDLGVNFIDTADAYGPETSENLIHDALAPYDSLVIATKGGMLRGGPGDWRPDGRPEHLREACEASRKRLGVEQIAVYQFHRPDPSVPFEESVKALIDLKTEGKIKHIGLSNVSLAQLKQALGMCEIVSVQNHYNFEHRADSEEILKFCEEEGVAFIPYFPMGGNQGGPTEATVDKIAQKHQATPHQIALAWLLGHSPVMLPIPGTGSIEHLEENISAASIHLDEEDFAAIEKLFD